jgi:hypothetical protein
MRAQYISPAMLLHAGLIAFQSQNVSRKEMGLTREMVLIVNYTVNDMVTNVVLSMVRFIHAVDIKTHLEHTGPLAANAAPRTGL